VITGKIPADKKLLVKNSFTIDNRRVNKDELSSYVVQKPNRRTLFFRTGAWIYLKTENSQRRFPSWLRETFGEAPVYYDSLATEGSREQFRIYLNDRGFYSPTITSHTHTRGRRNNKVRVRYTISTGNQYMIRYINYAVPDSNLLALIKQRRANAPAALTAPMVLDMQLLQNEQQRIARRITSAGYFGFTADNVFFAADTSRGYNDVHLEVSIRPNSADAQGLYRKYRIGNVFVFPDFNPSDAFATPHYDTLRLRDSVYFLSHNPRFLRPVVIDRINTIHPGDWYSSMTVDRMQRQLSQFKLFKLSTITFAETQKPDSTRYGEVDCRIQLSPFAVQSLGMEIEGTTTSGDWGAGITLNYGHKNIFRGAENFYIRTRTMGGNNRALRNPDGRNPFFNTYELGLEVGLEIPNFLSPIKPKMDTRYTPFTTIRAAYNINKTVDFTRPTSQISFGYKWNADRYTQHLLNPIDISYINYSNESQRFLDFLNNKSYYKYSFEDYLIYNSNYSYTYFNKPLGNSVRNYKYFKFYVEPAGNIMATIFKLANAPTNESGSYEMFGTKFAQYVKFEGDYRFFQPFSQTVMNVYRMYAGVAIPYGNSEGLPSVKKFYAGGASSMRAWASRTLGPGAFNDTTETLKYYLGDVKLEANFETRFPMFWIFNGAFFVDAGNIWSWHNSSMDGAEFFAKSFFKQIAIGTGFGLRMDLSFLLLRFDLGLKVKEPFTVPGAHTSFIWGSRPLTGNDWNLTFAIGYPF
jgi:outer membrane protein assembly factor BamA